jgi:putative FmdB family regulatory protein
MPTYDYHCPDCRTQFQVHHAMAAASPDCPVCGALPQRVILAAPAVHGRMARGRESAIRTFEKQGAGLAHGPCCPCCH